MARRVHAEGRIERKRMQSHDPSGKWDVGYYDDEGEWHHITRISDEQEARERAAALDGEPQELIAYDGTHEVIVRQVA